MEHSFVFAELLSRGGDGIFGLRAEAGQAMTEYLVLLVVVALGLSFMMTALPNAVSDYMQALYFCISRPVP